MYDFGKIKSGEPVKYAFVFTNTGDALLVLASVQPSCGCTTAGEWSRQVEPGKTGTIPVQFNSAAYNGPVLKTVTVTCNDKLQPAVALQLKGTVWQPIEVQPKIVVLTIPPGAESNVTTSVHILNHMDEPLGIWGPESHHKGFSAEIRTNSPGQDFQVLISALPPFSPAGAQGQITLKTSATNMPVISIATWANVQPAASKQATLRPAERPGGQPVGRQTE